MKKLFAIAMVLAMALAIAAPALASGWDALPTTSPTFKDITIKITALETEPNTSVLGSLYEQLSVMYPLVKGTVVHFYVEISIPKAQALSAATQALLISKGLDYEIGLKNIELTKAKVDLNGAKTTYNKAALDGTSPAEVLTVGPEGIVPNDGYYVGIEYWGAGLEAGKDGVVTATIGFYNEWLGGVFLWDNDADGVDEFVVIHDAVNGLFIIQRMTSPDLIIFPVDETTGKVDPTREVILIFGGLAYAVNRSVTNDITFRDATNYVYNPGDTTLPGYAALKTAFDSFFTALGFGYPEAKYMTEDHFTKYFGTIMETSVKIVYPSGTVVVAPPTVEPPQTGDATTVVGFVMIALALVAAAFVTVRKVRA